MRSTSEHLKIKTVGKNGRVYIGKRHAGRRVLVDTSDPHIIRIRMVTIIPDDEGPLDQAETAALSSSAAGRASTTPSNTDNAN